MVSSNALRRSWSKIVERTDPSSVIGFACAVAWPPTLLMAATSENMFGELVSKAPHGACMPALLASVAVCFILLLSRRKGNLIRLLKKMDPAPLGIAMAAIASVLFIPVYTQSPIHEGTTLVVVCSGILVTVLYLLWMQSFGLQGNQKMFLSLSFAQILTCAINAVLSLVNIYTVVIAAVMLPLVSAFCLKAATRASEYGAGAHFTESAEGVPSKLLPKLAAVIFAWGVVDHALRGEFDALVRMQPSSFSFAIGSHVAVLVVVAAVIGSSYVLIAFKDRFRFGLLYRLVFLLGLSSILLLPVASSGHLISLGYACSVAMYQLVFLFMWIIAASAFGSNPEKAPKVFGLVYGFWSLGSFAGAFSSNQFIRSFSSDELVVLIFIAAFAVSLGFLFIFTEKSANILVRIIPLKRKAPFKEKCIAVAENYRLSVRETEIAMLIAQGRDSAHIQNKLYLSRGTVQTHRMHIYQKLGIHNRQELLDIIEQFQEESPIRQKSGIP